MNAISVYTSFEAMDDVDARSYQPMPRKQRRPEPRRKASGGAGGGFQCRRNKHHTWGSGAGARLADLRAFAGAIALLLVAVASPASADSFGTFAAVRPGTEANSLTGLGQLTHDYKAESLVLAAADVDVLDSADGVADWNVVTVSLPASSDTRTLSATQLAVAAVGPSQWPTASDSVSPIAQTDGILAAASTSDVPEPFGEYVNTYSTYGQWETIGAEASAAPSVAASLLAFGDSTAAGTPSGGEEFLLTNLDRSAGSRVAVVAVPEPNNIVAAAIALGGLIAVNLVRRRKMVPARVLAC